MLARATMRNCYVLVLRPEPVLIRYESLRRPEISAALLRFAPCLVEMTLSCDALQRWVRATKLAGTLATKLRFCPLSRLDIGSPGRGRPSRPISEARPWERELREQG